MDSYFYTDIPTWNKGLWTSTSFSCMENFRDFLTPLFKEPGKYAFDETSFLFNTEAVQFRKYKFYCDAPYLSKDYVDYWNNQKEKCRKGVIFITENNTWYLTRDYYMWLNFLPINDKEQKKFDFAQIRDAQYHISLYDFLAELNYEHSVIVKKRQIANSYLHCGQLVNLIWFEETPILKIGAAEKRHVNEEGDWKFLEEYRNFLNEHTAWYRPMNPGKVGLWQQQIEITGGNRKTMKGGKGVLQMLTFDKAPEKGIGGPCHRRDTLILMASGEYKKIENIFVGEYVLGIDNKPKQVVQKFNGFSDMYRVQQIRGVDYYTTGEHLLYLINRDKKVSVLSKGRLTKTKDWNKLTTYKKRCYVGVKSSWPLEFFRETSTVTLDPYFLGLWLGDGYRCGPTIIINQTKDPEIIVYLEALGARYNTSYKLARKEALRYKDTMFTLSYNLSQTRGVNTYFTDQFIKYNLFYNKHIPKDFLYGSVDVRKQVLAGIIDTDGHYDSEKGRFTVTSMDLVLAEQIAFLCRSLGGYVRMGKASSNEHVVQGKIVKYTETNVVTAYFMNPDFIPTKVFRKRGRNNRNDRSIHTSPIESVVYMGEEEYFGIEVEDSLYYLADLTIAHNCTRFFYDEGGNAPTADTTYRYLRPAMRSGMITTGMFIIAGSVGELDKADPIKKFILNPKDNGFRAVTTNLIDEKGTFGETGLFIPEQWSMPPFIDKYGNSLVEEALKALDAEFEDLKRKLTPAEYQLEVSQRPRNLAEAFAFRKVAIFPPQQVQAQKRRIEEKLYPSEFVDIVTNEKGELIFQKSNKLPIKDYPITKTDVDKEGVIVVWERPFCYPVPPELAKYYYATIDPVGEGRTTTSESLCAIYIYKRDVLVTRDGEEVETFVEQGKIVAAWCGRFDDINKTHERLQHMIEMYGAWTLVENNISGFITHMINKKRQHYLVPKSQIMFLKDLHANENVFAEYGWKNTGNLFKTHLLSEGIEFLKEEIDAVVLENGDIKKRVYGVERIPDIMLIKEMESYQPGMNVDRLVAYCALVAFIKVQQANRGFPKRNEGDGTTKKIDKSLYAKPNSFFREGKKFTDDKYNVKKGLFRNLK